MGDSEFDLPKLDDLLLDAVQPFKFMEVLRVESGCGFLSSRIDVPKLPELKRKDAFLSLRIANVQSRRCGGGAEADCMALEQYALERLSVKGVDRWCVCCSGVEVAVVNLVVCEL